MKRDFLHMPASGFTVLIAALTFAVAVVAGLFLIWQSGQAADKAAQTRAVARHLDARDIVVAGLTYDELNTMPARF